MIPVIDIFAGPGGLGEGFSALTDTKGKQIFKIALSIEKDPNAHETLTLRSFFRQFDKNEVPNEYYDFVKGIISIENLYSVWPDQAYAAKEESWLAKLGDKNDIDAVSGNEVDKRIIRALKNKSEWLLIGGPPCQAYSVVGRSRRQQTILDEKTDERVGLYKQYLRILAVHNPAVFVMENVKGLLSAETKDSPVFSMILKDLADPVTAYKSEYGLNGNELTCPGYKIFSLTVPPNFDLFNDPRYEHKDYLIYSEKYGIPQTRHRVILLGIRKDIDFIPDILNEQEETPISKVLSGLPRLRSGLSKSENKEGDNWIKIIKQILKSDLIDDTDKEVKSTIKKYLKRISIPQKNVGAEYISFDNTETQHGINWFLDKKLDGVCNHISRGHMESDLHRYFFVSCFAKVHKRSPKLEDFPKALLPNHENANDEDKKFADRFRVQLWNHPSKTITSHISKDGHYYIHPDPTQCRSFTVREAARIQTFPDNYFFCGPRTSQFVQVGNAVPPLLAHQIAKIVFDVFQNITNNLTQPSYEYR
jgi:DNA (cytosine-5)-methyltransferase 1